jgi:hypothetical protein
MEAAHNVGSFRFSGGHYSQSLENFNAYPGAGLNAAETTFNYLELKSDRGSAY